MDIRAAARVPVNGTGPEDVLVDSDGRIYTGLDDHRIIRISGDGTMIETIAETPGRPLGIEFYGPDELLVCASDHGLVVVTLKTGAVRTLADKVMGAPILCCNNAAVAADGTVYFSDSSQRYPIPEYRKEMLELTGTGRLLRRDPTGEIEEVLGGLQFANGVALAPDESFVVVAETTAAQIRRVALTGSSDDSGDMLISDLAGYPDNASTGSDGLIWVAVPAVVNPLVGPLRKAPAAVRSLVHRLPESIQPTPPDTGQVLGLNRDGTVVHDISGEIADFRMLTGVRERDGALYFGSLESSAVAILRR